MCQSSAKVHVACGFDGDMVSDSAGWVPKPLYKLYDNFTEVILTTWTHDGKHTHHAKQVKAVPDSIGVQGVSQCVDVP